MKDIVSQEANNDETNVTALDISKLDAKGEHQTPNKDDENMLNLSQYDTKSWLHQRTDS